MKDKNMILKLVPRARQFKKNITRHLPRSMQEQRKALLTKASELFTSGKRIRWKLKVRIIAFTPTVRGYCQISFNYE